MRMLSELARFDRVKAAQAVGTAAVNSDIIDMAAAEGFDSVCFLVLWGTITDGTPLVKGQQGAAANMSDAADLEGTSCVAAITDDDKISVLDIHRPIERYVRAVLTRGGSTGAVVDAIVAILYDSKKEPVTQSDDVAIDERHVSPAEGTA